MWCDGVLEDGLCYLLCMGGGRHVLNGVMMDDM